MDFPRILAVADVRIPGAGCDPARIMVFYRDLLGLEPVPGHDVPDILAFRAFPRSGPRLLVERRVGSEGRTARREAALVVASLEACAESLAEHDFDCQWFHGWGPYSRYLAVQDPAGNRIELFASHTW